MIPLEGRIQVVAEEARILDFDIEASPGAWYGGDWVTKRVLAIAASWIVEGRSYEVEVKTRQRRRGSTESMLRWFKELYDEADVVTGHFIRGYDIPVLQSAMFRYGLPLLGPKMTHCTKGDLVKMTGISKSQENLGILQQLDASKFSMNPIYWEEAGDLTVEGLALVRERAVADVTQHVELRGVLMDRGALSEPRLWRPKASGLSNKYVG